MVLSTFHYTCSPNIINVHPNKDMLKKTNQHPFLSYIEHFRMEGFGLFLFQEYFCNLGVDEGAIILSDEAILLLLSHIPRALCQQNHRCLWSLLWWLRFLINPFCGICTPGYTGRNCSSQLLKHWHSYTANRFNGDSRMVNAESPGTLDSLQWHHCQCFYSVTNKSFKSFRTINSWSYYRNFFHPNLPKVSVSMTMWIQVQSQW